MRFKKIISNLMCTTLILSNILTAMASNVIVTENPIDENLIQAYNEDSQDDEWNTEESNLELIEVTYTQASNYSVTIPKLITLNSNKRANYSVKVTGDIGTNERVYVSPVDAISSTENLDFYMKDTLSKKDDVTATITHNKFYWDSDEVASSYEESGNVISAPDLSAGTWKGTFEVEIKLQSEKEHEHNFVNGVCSCGAIDPEHEHNYEDGVCTICGEKKHEHNFIDGICSCGEIDQNHTHNYEEGVCTICGTEEDTEYDYAPASAYSNWNYTLDDENDIITLNYYIGDETDVIVYANYEVDGKVYKTQIASFFNDTKSSDSSISYMFQATTSTQPNCKNIESIIFSKNIDTSNVTNMERMFAFCTSLTYLDISGFNTSNVTNMSYMFYANSFDSLDISNFDTSKVINMESMFYSCANLISLDLSNFNTSNVGNMGYMFHGCKSLINLNVSNFDTSNATSMYCTFAYCSSLTSLDLSSFDTHNVSDMRQMFYQNKKLIKIYATSGKWSTSKADTYYMFEDCGTSKVTYK